MNDYDKLVPLLPIKKNKTGKIIDANRRAVIINQYKIKSVKHSELPVYKIVKMIADSMGIGKTTVSNVIKEYKEKKTVTIPKTKRAKKSIIDTIGEFHKDVILTHVQQIRSEDQLPTIDRVFQAVSADKNLPSISRTNLYRLLKSLDSVYTRRNRNNTQKTNELPE